ncbi:MAG: quinolinate synthase NadA [Fusobacteriaceae bacterium]|nr:quinolinate synthase NadA [Fusobacteriaceae bacterium]MBN2838975.1 quinolinate synthase NadA [Fusobacteriaceae bacterium]
MNLIEEIKRLKKERNAIILAHYYQNPEVQEIADYVGDSYFLSEIGKKSEAQVIVYCGVQFMAESAKILSPEKIVLFPAYTCAPCCMENQANEKLILEKIKEYPNAKVVTYINSSSGVKAASHAVCTSSSALQVVNNIDADEILFVPDKNLASWVQEQTTKKIIPYEGCCNIHDRVKPSDLEEALEKNGPMKILAHPECRPSVRAMADYVGSTAGILKAIEDIDADKYLIVTEKGIAHEIGKRYPDKKFVYLNMFCSPMKKIFPETIYEALNELKYELTLPEDIINRAKMSLENMHYYANKK